MRESLKREQGVNIKHVVAAEEKKGKTNHWVHQHDVVIAGNHIPKCRELFFDVLEGDCIWEGIVQVLQLLVCCCQQDEQPMVVACHEAADDVCAANGGVHNGDNVTELGIKDGVEVGAALDSGECVHMRWYEVQRGKGHSIASQDDRQRYLSLV